MIEQELEEALDEIRKGRGIKKTEKKGLLDKFTGLLKLIEKYKGKKKFTDGELKKIQSILCFKDLSFCCRKFCVMRNTVLHILGIEIEYFEKEKMRIMRNWLKRK